MSSNQLTVLTNKLAAQFDLGNGEGLLDTLKKTAFKGNVTDDQMAALLVIANQYKLNPWTNEIYAFPSRGGITPVVGVDGWARIINANPQFDGIEFEQDDNSCTCKIYCKDRSHPVSVTEFLSECKRETDPWKSHPKRMLRHKTMIQAARLAFGFAGIYDEDEAERVRNAQMNIAENESNPFLGQTENPRRAELIKEGEAAAFKGTEALKQWFISISAEERKIIGIDEKDRLKVIVEQTIDTELAKDNQSVG